MNKRSIIFIIFGPSGVGKTTASKIVAQKFKIKIFASDKIRRSQEFIKQTSHYQKIGIFFPVHLRRKIYTVLIQQAKTELAKGKSVILDATFSRPWMWQMCRNLQKQTKAGLVPIEIVYQKISDESILKRLNHRIKKDPGAALPQTHWTYGRTFVPLKKKHFQINNDKNKAEMKKQINKIINQYVI